MSSDYQNELGGAGGDGDAVVAVVRGHHATSNDPMQKEDAGGKGAHRGKQY